jgi:hypothetical protein
VTKCLPSELSDITACWWRDVWALVSATRYQRSRHRRLSFPGIRSAGAWCCEEQQRQRSIAALRRRAADLGFAITPTAVAAPA